MKNIYEKIIEKSNTDAALCIVVSTRGSAPAKTGAKMLVYENGKIHGTVGGGNLEKEVIENAIHIIHDKKPKIFRHDLLHQHNMCCGGTVEIYIEPIMKKNKLYIFGAGHIGQSLAQISAVLDFETVLIDEREEYIKDGGWKMEDGRVEKENISLMNLEFSKALNLLPFDEQTYIAIVTYSHEIDRDILAFCIKKPHAYLGMIGSKRKIEVTKKMFLDAGNATKNELENVDMPIGIDINAEIPEEIAVSILSKIIQVKNKKLIYE